jgi:cholesterol transport system auxiliary component
MNTMNKIACVRLSRLIAAGLSVLALAACATLQPTAMPSTAFYALEAAPPSLVPTRLSAAPTLMVNPTSAAAGFDSPRIIYVREAHKLEYFAHNEWVDTPTRMLAPLLVAALENTGAFRAVVLSTSSATADLRLDTEIIRLQQEFLSRPSSVRFTLRAYLVDDKTRRVLAWHEFDAVVPAASEDPYGGVLAANRAVQTVLGELSAFCAEAARGLRVKN